MSLSGGIQFTSAFSKCEWVLSPGHSKIFYAKERISDSQGTTASSPKPFLKSSTLKKSTKDASCTKVCYWHDFSI